MTRAGRKRTWSERRTLLVGASITEFTGPGDRVTLVVDGTLAAPSRASRHSGRTGGTRRPNAKAVR